MKILLSAYACEPHKGSEPEVGWKWATCLAELGHEVWVITRRNNRETIETEAHPPNLRFEYFDLPYWMRWWKRGARGSQFYYFLWQMGVYFLARRLQREIAFDRIHHVTFVNVRTPSFLGLLGVPFIFGPVSGGERTPWPLRKSFPVSGKLWDFFRDIANALVRFDPLMHLTFSSASKIYATTQETQALIPRQYHPKVSIQLAIGIEAVNEHIQPKETQTGLKLLYAGNILYLKGIHLAFRAFSLLHQKYPKSTLTIVGSGRDEAWLQNLAKSLSIASAIEWKGQVSRQELWQLYPLYDVFLFPSLHDSGGMVILEAMANALPVVCLSLGGPREIVDSSIGYCIETDGCSEAEVVTRLGEALVTLAKDPGLRKLLGCQAHQAVKSFQWKQQVQHIYESTP